MHIDPRETLQSWIDRGGNMITDNAVAAIMDKAALDSPRDLRAFLIEDLFRFSRLATREICNFATRQDDPELCADENLPKLKEWTRAELADAIHVEFIKPAKLSDPSMARRAGITALRDALGLTKEDCFAAAKRANV